MLKEYFPTPSETKPGKTLIDFYSRSCGPCRMMEPILAKLAEEFEVVKVCVDDYPTVAMRWHVRNLPTLVIVEFPNGTSDMMDRPEYAVKTFCGVIDASTLRRALEQEG